MCLGSAGVNFFSIFLAGYLQRWGKDLGKMKVFIRAFSKIEKKSCVQKENAANNSRFLL